MTANIHCPMIHGGLTINLKNSDNKIFINQCCLRFEKNEVSDIASEWNGKKFSQLRELNNQNLWDSGCWMCQGNELAGIGSFRTGTLEKFGYHKNLSGPQRIDLMFDIGCNLACRSCGPDVSTFWQKHLKENNIPFIAPGPETRVDKMIDILKTLDLSNLEMVVFCGGETLLGRGHWQVAEAIANMVPNAKEKITLSFQTNGTQPISEKNYKIIERFQLVKLNISLDGVGERFNYLRWPAKWDQVIENILNLRETLPVNVMFLIEETMSIFNLYYQNELDSWAKQNFSTNRLGDIVNHSRHSAKGTFSLNNLSSEYVKFLQGTNLQHLIHKNWKENPTGIAKMINEIQKFDAIRGEDWRKTFPEVAALYSKFL